jgi:hypothetical protein
MAELREMMMKEALLAGGKPVGGRSSLQDCFTYDAELELLMLWYNKEMTTKVISRKCSSKDVGYIRPQSSRRGYIRRRTK